ncbi:MAG: RluA family pseudouridine synthase [Lentisphaeria bacterium]|jgi:23S rRNA pseudouridine1911/1915/1917 synthase
MGAIIQELCVTPEQAGRVDKAVQALTGRSRAQVRGLVQHGCVTVNGAPCASDFTQVVAGDRVAVRFDPAQGYPEKATAAAGAPFRILFEDAHLLVVEKAAHLLTVPTLKRETDTLVHHLQTYVSVGRRRLGRVEIVHRLDRGVSGVLVFAKNAAIAEALREQFAAHKPEREYLALVAGRLAADRGTFDQWLVTDAKSIHRRGSPRPGVGERAVTHYEVVRRLADATLVRVRLETGRRNQIRVHFAEAGHPVLGDPRYAPELARHPRWPYPRLALHAGLLAFTHPVTGRPVRGEAPLPREFERFLGGGPAAVAAGRKG